MDGVWDSSIGSEVVDVLLITGIDKFVALTKAYLEVVVIFSSVIGDMDIGVGDVDITLVLSIL